MLDPPVAPNDMHRVSVLANPMRLNVNTSIGLDRCHSRLTTSNELMFPDRINGSTPPED